MSLTKLVTSQPTSPVHKNDQQPIALCELYNTFFFTCTLVGWCLIISKPLKGVAHSAAVTEVLCFISPWRWLSSWNVVYLPVIMTQDLQCETYALCQSDAPLPSLQVRLSPWGSVRIAIRVMHTARTDNDQGLSVSVSGVYGSNCVMCQYFPCQAVWTVKTGQ